jgi:hypothetical protein
VVAGQLAVAAAAFWLVDSPLLGDLMRGMA